MDLYVLPKLFGTTLNKDQLLTKFAREKLDSIGVSKETILKKREDVHKQRAMKEYMVRLIVLLKLINIISRFNRPVFSLSRIF